METRHVKIDYESSLNSKKHLLNSEINLLHILRKLKAYRVFRDKELKLKSRLKVKLINLRKEINLIQYSLPGEGFIEVKKRRRKVIEETADIQGELEEIKKKLAKLK